MAHILKKPKKGKTDLALFWGSVILAILGTADAIYLLIYKFTGNSQMCLGSGGCHDVNFSPFSEIYGIPVSVFGIFANLAILCILFLERRLKIARKNGPLAIFGISLGGVFFTAYLTYLEIYIIRAICPFCVAAAILITLLFILAVIRLVKQTVNQEEN
jgi:uncharacterized membrane protein